MRTELGIAWALAVGLNVLSRPSDAAPAAHARRIAVLIGSNAAPPGRLPLRYAHDDAQRMADVLQRVGRFAPNDIHVLLDPAPAAIVAQLSELARIAQSPSDETLLFFYYSGHSDGQSVFPNGELLSLGRLRELLEAFSARVRVGLLDTCRGGSWTQAKGVTLGPPLDAVELLPLSSEGTALISSSSGFENAHEAALVQGSFFTHHFAAGLLGAADRSGDGNVTLQEAFDYSKERTIRDSAKVATTTQHPSFDLRIRGRQDIVLSQVAASSSALAVEETQGPLEVIQLATGVTVLEIPPGERKLRLALPPGKYLVRKLSDDHVRTKEVVIEKGATVTLAEGELTATGTDRLAIKGDGQPARPVSDYTTLPRNWWEFTFAAGNTIRANADASVMQRATTWYAPSLKYGITDRLELRLPLMVSYRFGRDRGVEFVPRIGLSDLSYGSWSGLTTSAGLSATLRIWTGANQSLFVATGASRGVNVPLANSQHVYGSTRRWGLSGYVGYHWLIQSTVTVQLHAGLGQLINLADDGSSRTPAHPYLFFGGAPLAKLHLSPRFSIDGTANWSVYLNGNDSARSDRYMLGFTWNF